MYDTSARRQAAGTLCLIVTLLAGYILSIHLAVLLHELGHAMGYWLGGGHVSRIVMLAPLPAGYVNGSCPNRYLPVWGGVTFGTLSALIPLSVARFLKASSPARFAGLLTASFCLAHNGLYLFVGSLTPFADAANMLDLGARRWALFLLGVPFIISFVLLLSSALRMLATRLTEPRWRWILLVELGLLAVPALMLSVAIFSPNMQPMRLPMLLLVTSYAVCFALAGWLSQPTGGTPESSIGSLVPLKWRSTFGLFAAASIIIGLEIIALRP